VAQGGSGAASAAAAAAASSRGASGGGGRACRKGRGSCEENAGTGDAPKRRPVFEVHHGETRTKKALAKLQKAKAELDTVLEDMEVLRKGMVDLEAARVEKSALVASAEALVIEARRKEAEVAQALAASKAAAAGSSAAVPLVPPATLQEQVLYILRRIRDGSVDEAVLGGVGSVVKELEGQLHAATGTRHASPSVYREPPRPSAVGGWGPGLSFAAGVASSSNSPPLGATGLGAKEVEATVQDMQVEEGEVGSGTVGAGCVGTRRSHDAAPPAKSARVGHDDGSQAVAAEAPATPSAVLESVAVFAGQLRELAEVYPLAGAAAAAAAAPAATPPTPPLPVEAWKANVGLLALQSGAVVTPAVDVAAASAREEAPIVNVEMDQQARQVAEARAAMLRAEALQIEAGLARRERESSEASGRVRSRSYEEKLRLRDEQRAKTTDDQQL
jgi:hypothetical protein